MHLYFGHAAGVWCYLERKGSPNPDQCLPGECAEYANNAKNKDAVKSPGEAEIEGGRGDDSRKPRLFIK